MMGHNKSFKGAIWKIIPKSSLSPLLIWSTEDKHCRPCSVCSQRAALYGSTLFTHIACPNIYIFMVNQSNSAKIASSKIYTADPAQSAPKEQSDLDSHQLVMYICLDI